MNELISMDSLRVGEKAIVDNISRESKMRRRFFDIGLTKDSNVECVGVSPMGDPKAYLIKGAVIAIRAADSIGVLVRRC